MVLGLFVVGWKPASPEEQQLVKFLLECWLRLYRLAPIIRSQTCFLQSQPSFRPGYAGGTYSASKSWAHVEFENFSINKKKQLLPCQVTVGTLAKTGNGFVAAENGHVQD